jgi:hypothetical protein
MKNLTKILAVAALASPLMSLAGAPNSIVSNVYLEGNAGVSRVSTTKFFNFLGGTDYGFGVNVNAGYEWSRHIAIETGYTFYSIKGKHGHLSDAVVKGILPLGVDQRMKLFAKLGPGYAFGNSDHDFVLFGGVGAGYSLTNQMDINLQLQGSINNFGDVGLLSLGFSRHFA